MIFGDRNFQRFESLVQRTLPNLIFGDSTRYSKILGEAFVGSISIPKAEEEIEEVMRNEKIISGGLADSFGRYKSLHYTLEERLDSLEKEIGELRRRLYTKKSTSTEQPKTSVAVAVAVKKAKIGGVMKEILLRILEGHRSLNRTGINNIGARAKSLEMKGLIIISDSEKTASLTPEGKKVAEALKKE